ncbi:MAG TPA: NADP oxidoreductase [Rhodobacteraceae bacterium]|nr:NADP oxidoreductase [Paracoccaceae bacterium]
MDRFVERLVAEVLDRFGSDRTRLMDMLWEVQRARGHISEDAIAALARGLDMSVPDVAETVTFYHFFRTAPFAQHVIYLADTVIARMNGYDEVRAALIAATGADFGVHDGTGQFGLDNAPCIGLSDQEPAMLVDDVVFSGLTPEKVHEIVAQLRSGKSAEELANPNAYEKTSVHYVDAVAEAKILKSGPVMFQEGRDYPALVRSIVERTPEEIIREVDASDIRGRGGAGFPAGLKWRLAREAEGAEKYVICNADEGEPGTFKDRALLTHAAKDVLLGMIAAAHTVGSRTGIIYLRAEYWYLKAFLEGQIEAFRAEGLLGSDILGSGLDFEIRIQMGAGAYVCGDETALIESCEGKRGTPRVKPPFPIQHGYLGMPTVVNNVETFALCSQIIDKGGAWFTAMGTEQSSGTRLLSISGDCERPGIYEIEWGITLDEVLKMVGAETAVAVQISGPSGEMLRVDQDRFRKFCYSDLSCNGSLMVFNGSRDLLDIARHFTEFFVNESCGICTPCRSGGVDLLTKIDRVIAGRAVQQDLDDFRLWGKLMMRTSRCGLGTTAPNPILTTLDKFPELYEAKLNDAKSALLASFDMEDAMSAFDSAVDNLVREDV